MNNPSRMRTFDSVSTLLAPKIVYNLFRVIMFDYIYICLWCHGTFRFITQKQVLMQLWSNDMFQYLEAFIERHWCIWWHTTSLHWRSSWSVKWLFQNISNTQGEDDMVNDVMTWRDVTDKNDIMQKQSVNVTLMNAFVFSMCGLINLVNKIMR